MTGIKTVSTEKCVCGHSKNRHTIGQVEYEDAPGFVNWMETEYCFIKNCNCTSYTSSKLVEQLENLINEVNSER